MGGASRPVGALVSVAALVWVDAAAGLLLAVDVVAVVAPLALVLLPVPLPFEVAWFGPSPALAQLGLCATALLLLPALVRGRGVRPGREETVPAAAVPPRPPARIEALTPREREVLAVVAEGRSNAAVARRLVVTEAAVAKHVNSILAKLDLPPAPDDHRRVLAVLAFLRAAGRSAERGELGVDRRGGHPERP